MKGMKGGKLGRLMAGLEGRQLPPGVARGASGPAPLSQLRGCISLSSCGEFA